MGGQGLSPGELVGPHELAGLPPCASLFPPATQERQKNQVPWPSHPVIRILSKGHLRADPTRSPLQVPPHLASFSSGTAGPGREEEEGHLQGDLSLLVCHRGDRGLMKPPGPIPSGKV